jgi:hypothetical protein
MRPFFCSAITVVMRHVNDILILSKHAGYVIYVGPPFFKNRILTTSPSIRVDRAIANCHLVCLSLQNKHTREVLLQSASSTTSRRIE